MQRPALSKESDLPKHSGSSPSPFVIKLRGTNRGDDRSSRLNPFQGSHKARSHVLHMLSAFFPRYSLQYFYYVSPP